MAQWVNDLACLCGVQVQSLAWCSGLNKDLALLQLWHRLQLWLRFKPWSRNFHMLQRWAKERERKKKRITFSTLMYLFCQKVGFLGMGLFGLLLFCFFCCCFGGYFDCTCSMRKFLGQGSHPHHSCN